MKVRRRFLNPPQLLSAVESIPFPPDSEFRQSKHEKDCDPDCLHFPSGVCAFSHPLFISIRVRFGPNLHPAVIFHFSLALHVKTMKPFKKPSRRSAQQFAVQQKEMNDDRFFWDLVRSFHGPGSQPFSQQQRAPIAASAAALFSTQGASGIRFCDYDAIPVSRSGGPPGVASIPPLVSFQQLKNRVPAFLFENLTLPDRMNYSTPTPIQKHCIPISEGAHGGDVMACAQTGSGKVRSC